MSLNGSTGRQRVLPPLRYPLPTICILSSSFLFGPQKVGGERRHHQPGDPTLPADGVRGRQRHPEGRQKEAASLQHAGECSSIQRLTRACVFLFLTFRNLVCDFVFCCRPGGVSEGQVGSRLQAELQPLQKHLRGCGPTASKEDGPTEVKGRK